VSFVLTICPLPDARFDGIGGLRRLCALTGAGTVQGYGAGFLKKNEEILIASTEKLML
jgi:hypothetical protein